ncbi:energy transducer TonB [Flavobacterium sp. RHBU_24]|uniref:energy transducer TonB n=1 Tax=Flavobacterium sp. RHBU_24 TaxID=3391185 RepID=UPI0039846B74
MANINIFSGQWIDMVFEGRNKLYGAYALRKENPKTTVLALIAGSIFFSLAIAAPIIISSLPKGEVAEEQVKEVELAEIVEPPKEEEPLPPPPPPVEEVYQAPKSVVDEVKFKPLEAAKKEEVPEDPPKIEQFKEADPSSRNKEADPNMGDIVIGKPAGDLDKGVEAPDVTVYNSAGLQVQPEYPGGIEAFYKYVNKNFRIPELDNDMTAKIYVSFVVEKDGTLTAIKVLRDPGFGLGKEAERVLKSLKTKWSPGIQNGKPVRAQYNLPITINIRS